MMSIVTLDHRKCKVQVIPGDGSCLFGSIAHQLFRYDVTSAMHTSHTRALRVMVVECIRDNIDDVRFVDLIKLRMQSEFRLFCCDDDGRNASTFLSILKNDRTYGASESLLAIAILFECEIVVYREGGFRTIVSDENSIPSVQISVVYRGQFGSWNHYDSFIGFIDPLPECETRSLCTVAWWSMVDFNDGSCFVLHTKPDGNCMFSAVAHQLFGLDMASSNHSARVTSLRLQAINYLRRHRLTTGIQNLLKDRMLAIFPTVPTPYTEAAYEALFVHLSSEGIWGGTECLVALSNLYHRDIRTIWEHGPSTCIRTVGTSDADLITLVYRKSGQQWIHYDSFLCFERTRFSTGLVNSTATVDLTTDASSTAPPLSQFSRTAPAVLQKSTPSGSSHILSSHCPGVYAAIRTNITSLRNVWPLFKICTWNVRGANSLVKRVAIDDHLSMLQFGIIALQETKLVSRTCDTGHYKWVLGLGAVHK